MSPEVPERVARLVEHMRAWAASRSDVSGVALVGSHARQAAIPASDVDLVIACESPAIYVENTAWVRAFGAPRRIAREDWGRVTSVRVWFEDGLEVEFGIADREWGSVPLDAGTRRVIEDGCIILFHRGAGLSGLR